MSGLEQAAAAFDADLGGNEGGARETLAVESVFPHFGRGTEVDEESPAIAGGDTSLPEGVDPNLVEEDERQRRRPVQRRAPAQTDDGEDGQQPDPYSDDVLYADDEEGSPPKGEEGEDDPDGEAEELPEDALDAKVMVTVDGEEKEVTVREALNGYIRTETLHRRLSALDQGRQEVEQEAHRVVALRQQTSESLQLAEEILKSILPEISQDEWDRAFQQDPQKARAMQRSYAEIQAKIDKVKAERNKVDEGTNQEQVRNTNKWIAQEAQRFNDANPQWAAGDDGAKKREKDLKSMARTAKAVGFSDQEILGVYDSRMLQILLKASRYDRMMAARPKPGNGVKTARPGAGRVATAPRGVSRAAQALQRTGSVEAAGQLFSELITPRRK